MMMMLLEIVIMMMTMDGCGDDAVIIIRSLAVGVVLVSMKIRCGC